MVVSDGDSLSLPVRRRFATPGGRALGQLAKDHRAEHEIEWPPQVGSLGTRDHPSVCTALGLKL